ncbi:MAG TPA: S-layer homology domain-containing protein [Candidatus Limenecus avicola]|uniref:S-layer homology domain-containing protein n=1 Tax=Candidatus Limenecus avicola TaxID=2840847 RepID=A0A9D1MZ80_9CLOT|nr:S-layer homology domain-containing protein [Candidatus Limenecus avicola]
MKKLLTKALMLAAILGFTSAATFAKDYADLPKDHWAYKQIQILTDFNVVVGYPDGNYRPEQNVTRAEFATMVIKAFEQQKAEIKQPAKFTDVSEKDWFYGMVQRAVMFDLLKGYPDGHFDPYGNVSRGHVISTTVNALTTETISNQKAKEILENSYSDYDQIPDWLIIAAGKAEILGMVVKAPGEETVINAERPATRAELAAFLVKMLEQAKLNPNAKLKEAMSPRTGEGIIIPTTTLEGYIATIPAGTVIPIMVLNKSITSQKSKAGEQFLSKLPKNLITKEKYLLLVENDALNGKIASVKVGRLFIRNGEVTMETHTITTDKNQTAAFCGDALGGYRPEGFWKTLYLKVVKGHRVQIKEGDILNLKLNKPVRIDLTNGMILE